MTEEQGQSATPQSGEEVRKITKLCSAINQLVLNLEDKNKSLSREMDTLTEQVEQNSQDIASLKRALGEYVQ